jgi:alpha-L-fucosidase
MLADIVSKNGNLMLSVPLNRDGVPDSDEIKIVTDIGAWLKVNGDAIYATRPWKTFGEGPSTTADVSARGGRPAAVASKPYTPEDIRFTQSKDGKTLYAIVLAIPADGKITIKSLSGDSPNWTGKIGSVRLLGVSGDLKFTRDEKGLHVTLPETVPSKFAVALQIQS